MNRILIKLLAINIVASNFFGLSNSLLIKSIFFVLFSFAWSKWCLDREKNAISAPEISADESNKNIKTIISMPICQLKEKSMSKLMGSGSKGIVFKN